MQDKANLLTKKRTMMKTRFIRTKPTVFFFAITVFAAIAFTSYKAKMQYANERNLFLEENVEALTENESEGSSECMGPPRYEETGIFEGKEEEREHIGDDKDIVTIYNVRRCYAEGVGEYHGVDGFLISSNFVSSHEETCNKECDYYN